MLETNPHSKPSERPRPNRSGPKLLEESADAAQAYR